MLVIKKDINCLLEQVDSHSWNLIQDIPGLVVQYNTSRAVDFALLYLSFLSCLSASLEPELVKVQEANLIRP